MIGETITRTHQSRLEVAEMRDGSIDILEGRHVALVHLHRYSELRGRHIVYLQAIDPNEKKYPKGIFFFIRTANDESSHSDLADYVGACRLLPPGLNFVAGGRYKINRDGSIEEGIASGLYQATRDSVAKHELENLLEKFLEDQ